MPAIEYIILSFYFRFWSPNKVNEGQHSKVFPSGSDDDKVIAPVDTSKLTFKVKGTSPPRLIWKKLILQNFTLHLLTVHERECDKTRRDHCFPCVNLATTK